MYANVFLFDLSSNGGLLFGPAPAPLPLVISSSFPATAIAVGYHCVGMNEISLLSSTMAMEFNPPHPTRSRLECHASETGYAPVFLCCGSPIWMSSLAPL